MKKLLIRFAGVLLAVIALSSCTKEDESYWCVETSTIEYYDYDDYGAFIREIRALDDGVTWTVNQVRREVSQIVNKYDGDLGGTVYLKTGPSMSGPWTTKKTWVMRLR